MAEERDLLVEVGTEELPPTALRRLMDAFHDGIVSGLETAEVAYRNSHRYASPRRLAVLVEGVPEQQPAQDIERRGPALSAAYNDQGQPTRAAQGFARSCGVALDELDILRTGKGEWLVYRDRRPGARTVDLLPEIVDNTLAALPVPKRMRWGSSQATFVRPVHWVVALLGTEVVDMTVLDNRTGRETRGHRFHAPQPLRLAHAGEYERRLREEGYVIADFDRRRAILLDDAQAKAAALGGELVADEALIDEVAALVEWPVALTGRFDERFLEVPAEALISSMQGHQKVFPVAGPDGTLMARFVTIANLESRDPDEVVRGNERVIRPRLADAEFFWNQDRKRPLAERVDDLRQIVFQQRLGSLHDKQLRVATLARSLAEEFRADPDRAERAAMIAKCDLLTEMVDEFPELQGTMGRYYARQDGEGEDVAAAMEEQYRPRFAGDDTPVTPLGQALAIADRADTLVGIFAIGQPPTGDKDPFALRRAALGLARTLIEGERHIDLRRLFTRAASCLPEDLGGADQVEAVRDFCMERLKGYYQEQGISPEVFDAVDAVGVDDPLDFHHRVHACAGFLELEAAASLAAANKRVRNILRKNAQSVPEAPVADRFVMEEERNLAACLEPLVAEIDELAAAGHYEQALTRLASLRQPVDAFFDQVMVMAEDPAVRTNRLALLNRLAGLLGRVADISRLPSGSA